MSCIYMVYLCAFWIWMRDSTTSADMGEDITFNASENVGSILCYATGSIHFGTLNFSAISFLSVSCCCLGTLKFVFASRRKSNYYWMRMRIVYRPYAGILIFIWLLLTFVKWERCNTTSTNVHIHGKKSTTKILAQQFQRSGECFNCNNIDTYWQI